MATPSRIMTSREFHLILSDANNQGKVFAVARDLFEEYAAKLYIRPINDRERREVSRLIGAPVHATDAIGLTRTFSCQHCLHEFTFADHVRAAIDMAVHSTIELAQYINGSDDGVYYLAVDTDKGREVRCVSCGKTVIVPHCCYATSSYAYAKTQERSRASDR
jgi:hypothetical protein